MKEKIKFYDLKDKKSFFSTNYTIKTKGKVKIAYTVAPSGTTSTRILGRA